MDPIFGPGDFNGDGGIAAPVDCSKVACVALTFDDGPDAPTNRLVDTLINTRTPATFFVIGNKISARASVTLKQHRNGLPVENHLVPPRPDHAEPLRSAVSGDPG